MLLSVRRVLLGCAVLGLAGCGHDWNPAELSQGKSSQVAKTLQRGRKVYANHCVSCHGEIGDGKGIAADFLDPSPRKFTQGTSERNSIIKFGRVESGQNAGREDYIRIVSHGLIGTAMPTFKLLPRTELEDVVDYVMAFYPRRLVDPAGEAVSVGPGGWDGFEKAAVKLGKRVYHTNAQCWSCHPSYVSREETRDLYTKAEMGKPSFRDDIRVSVAKESSWGKDITAPCFLLDRVKTGTELHELVHVIAAGVGGTAMPTWATALTDRELWGMAYYIKSLASIRDTSEAREMMAQLRASDQAAPKTVKKSEPGNE
jgi:mono/diheme cytochrome c family protein